MTSNLPQTQKTDWVSNDVVKPDDTNSWGRSINTLSKAVPIYASNGDFYTVQSYENNIITLMPLTYLDGTENETLLTYLDGMNIIFKATFTNTGECSVNVNELGIKQIKNIDNTLLKSHTITQGNYINLRYDKLQDCFYLILSNSGGSGLEICDIGMALYVDEAKGLRRYLNGQIVGINTNTQAFLNRLQQITTLHPSLLCTEEEWQTAKTMSAFGQVGKFVFNYNGADIVSVRLPRVVNVQGLFDLQNLGMTVEAGLPNIKGDIPNGRIFTTTSFGSDISPFKKASVKAYNAGTEGSTANANSIVGFDASLVEKTYGNSNTVQPEAIQYPYFIQIATGSGTENNITNEIELNNPYSLFDSKYSDHELNNLSWLKSEGQWNSGTVYVDAYNELLTEYNNSASSEEIEGSITFKRTPKGYKIALADQETTIDTKYTTNGIAWYYIIDTVNSQFKLPRTKFGFEGVRDGVGNDIQAGSPNIIGSAGMAHGNPNTSSLREANGAFAVSNPATTIPPSGSGTATCFQRLNFDASRSNPIYGNTDTVQEPATQMYLYFYVGETAQNANLIDAGRIGEQLANKADITTPSIQAPYIKDTYKNGDSWYRIWSDGWCEQGGKSAVANISPKSGNTKTVTFLKTFRDTNCSAVATGYAPQTDAGRCAACVQTPLSVNSMTLGCYNFNTSASQNIKVIWSASGYLAEGEY